VSPGLRALLEAGIALASELSLDSLLQRLTELSAELTGARYAALGVIGGNLYLTEERRRRERVDSVFEDPEVDRGDNGGEIGLVGMRERIELLDGTLTVESSAASGTTVAAEVPA
jgi:hypothetical protein